MGNYVAFSYEGNGNGNYDISAINYTGHGRIINGNIIPDAGYSPYATIEFTYDKARLLSSYIAGRSIVRDVRLTGISTHVAGRAGPPVSRYALEYEERNTSNRFVLTRLHQYGSDGQELQPTVFDYTKPPIGWVDAGYQFPNSVILAGLIVWEQAIGSSILPPQATFPISCLQRRLRGSWKRSLFETIWTHCSQALGLGRPWLTSSLPLHLQMRMVRTSV